MNRLVAGLAVALAVSALLNVYAFYTISELSRVKLVSDWKTACVKLGNQVVKVYVADTPEKRAEGFRHKDRVDFLGVNASGMIFVFENTPSVVVFDMRDVKFKLKLVHVVRTLIGDYIAEVVVMEPEKTYPIKTYGTKDYFIELDPRISITTDEVKLTTC